ncbi:OmpP1/FadL family transporter [Ruegeria sp.]|uniref:OmpP1/FadL family transporter n=1 Tax=Ruegeria sp. TaxID=1879320 RepID=UPI003B5A4701
MNRNTAIGAAFIAATASTATAGGFDLTGQRLEDLFQTGRYASGQIVFFSPDISGTTGPFGPVPQQSTGDTANSVFDYNLSFKDDINDKWSYLVSTGQPFARESVYSEGFFTGGAAEVTVQELTALLRYKFTDRISVYGGPRLYRGQGSVDSPSPFVPDTVDLDTDYTGGFVIGAAYEIPEYFARVSLTYSSDAELDMNTTSGGAAFGDGNTVVEIPQSINLAAQAPINRKTLLFGDVRWVEWSETEVNPGGDGDIGPIGELVPNIVDLEDTITYRLGAAYQFNDKFTGLVGISYEDGDGEALNGLFNRVDGYVAYSIGGIYSPTENVDIRLTVSYANLGDRSGAVGTPLGPVPTSFTDNSAYSVGLKVGFRF